MVRRIGGEELLGELGTINGSDNYSLKEYIVGTNGT